MAWPVLGAGAAAQVIVVIGAIARARVTRPARQATDHAEVSARLGTLRSNRTRGALTVAAALIVAIVAGALVAGVAVAVTVLVHHLEPIRATRRRQALIDRALPEAMELLVLSVRAGLTPFQAVGDLATFDEPAVGDAFAEVVRRTQRGQPFADALTALPDQLGTRAGGLADVIATSDRHGLPIGPVLDQLAAEIRSSRRRLDQADARKLPVRLAFPLVVCTLPSFVLLAIAPAVIAALSSLGGTAW